MARGVSDLAGYRLGPERGSTNAYAIHVGIHETGPAATVKISHADATSVLATEREAWALDRLRHPAIPELYATGMVDGRCWLATTPIGTATLARYRELPVERVVALIRDLSETLAFAHDRCIVVRSLSPRSIVLGDPVTGRCTIADWSDAEVTGERSPCLDADLDYLAPELVRGGACSARSDLYAVGAIAYRALAGIAPTTHRAVTIPLAEACPEAPHHITTLIDRLLAQDPEQRPHTAHDVHEIAAQLAIDPRRGAVLDHQLLRRPKWTPNYMDAALPDVEWDLPSDRRRPR